MDTDINVSVRSYNIVVTVNYTRKIVAVRAYRADGAQYKHTVAEAYARMAMPANQKFDRFSNYEDALRAYPSTEWDIFVADTVPADEKLSRIEAYNRLFDAGGFTLLTHKKRK